MLTLVFGVYFFFFGLAATFYGGCGSYGGHGTQHLYYWLRRTL